MLTHHCHTVRRSSIVDVAATQNQAAQIAGDFSMTILRFSAQHEAQLTALRFDLIIEGHRITSQPLSRSSQISKLTPLIAFAMNTPKPIFTSLPSIEMFFWYLLPRPLSILVEHPCDEVLVAVLQSIYRSQYVHGSHSSLGMLAGWMHARLMKASRPAGRDERIQALSERLAT